MIDIGIYISLYPYDESNTSYFCWNTIHTSNNNMRLNSIIRIPNVLSSVLILNTADTSTNRVWAVLNRVRGFNRNPTLTGFGGRQVSLHSNITFLAPTWTPRVPYNPVVNAVLWPVPNSNHRVIKIRTTLPGENTLPTKTKPVI